MKSKVLDILVAAIALVPMCGHAEGGTLIGADSADVSGLPDRGVTDAAIHAGVRGTWVMPTNRYVRGSNETGSAVSAGVAPYVELTVRNAPGSRYGRWYPHAYQGIGIGVQTTFKSGVLGTPFLAYAVQRARIAALSSRLSLDYEWNFGLAMGWRTKKYDSTDEAMRLNGIGTPVTAYINLGVYMRYRLTERIDLFGGVEATHYSNGNTGLPNPGINMLGARMGVSYALGRQYSLRRADWSDFERGMVYDVSVYGAWRRWVYYPYAYAGGEDNGGAMLVPGKFAVVGFNINPMYRFNPVLSAGASVDGQYDEGANLTPNYVTATYPDDPRFYRTSFSDRISVGLSARVELRMSLFAINLGLGHSIFAPGGHDLRGWYNTFVLKTFFTDRIFLLTGYKLVRFNESGNLMLGAGFRI